MKRIFEIAILLLVAASCSRYVYIDNKTLEDKIKGAWAGKNVGVNFGRPTEFGYRSTMIPDSVDIVWTGHEVYDNWVAISGDDDVYMNMAFVMTLERCGFEAPADSFAVEFANAPFNLWHANQQGRVNILAGIMPPESGHWMNNPHADDIDFQIEADFAGILSPAMPNASSDICDKVGHIMNYGDGWYGGVFIAGMYTYAFLYDNVRDVVEAALRLIPEQSRYYRCISDVIRWHDENPDNWKATWQLVEDNYSESFGCAFSCGEEFNIDAVINSAYVVMGLLYGDMDIFRTMDIAARCGQDSDCNPASAVGVLGTVLGYSGMGGKYTDGVEMIEDCGYAHLGYTMGDLYESSIRLAKENILRCGGKVTDEGVYVRVRKPKTVRFEKAFEGQRFDRRHWVFKQVDEVGDFEFDGVGVEVRYRMNWDENAQGVTKAARVAVTLDGEVCEQELPLSYHDRKEEIFFRFGLEDGHHTLSLRRLDNDPDAFVEVQWINVFKKDCEPMEDKVTSQR